MPFYVGILLVAIRDLCADTLTAFCFGFHNGTDLLARIPCEPFVEEILERRELVAFALKRIIIVVDGDIPHVPSREQHLGIVTDFDIVSAKP